MGLSDQNVIKYPTVEQVIRIHDRLIREYRDSSDQIIEGVLSEGNIYWNIEFAKRAGNDVKELEAKIIYKAAHLMVRLFTSHPFIDGNKRTGFISFVIFLENNNLKSKVLAKEYHKHVHTFKEISQVHNTDESVSRIIDWYFNS